MPPPPKRFLGPIVANGPVLHPRDPRVEPNSTPQPFIRHGGASVRIDLPWKAVIGLVGIVLGGGGMAAMHQGPAAQESAQRALEAEKAAKQQARVLDCLVGVSRALATQGKALEQFFRVQGAINCRQGVQVRNMRCDSVEFEPQPLCPRGQTCPRVLKADADWPVLLPDPKMCQEELK